jgi:hypothetical protein
MPCDYKKYPDNWKSEIRPAILERDGNCCNVCKVPNGVKCFRGIWNNIPVFQLSNGDMFREDNGELIMHNSEYETVEGKTEDAKAIKIVLTIAHLNHDTNDNRYENLSALCQLHHLRHDVEHHKSTKYKKKKLQSLF